MAYEFNETIGIGICLCSRVGGEWEFTNLVSNTSSLEFLLVLSDPCDLGVSVDYRGDSIIVDVSVTGLDEFNSGDSYLSVSLSMCWEMNVPSSSALWASIGPKVTSPIARTPLAEVLN